MLNTPICIKLVRGAYLVEESKLAKEGNYENPIHDTMENTHACYDECAFKITNDLKAHDKVVIATHNENSVILLLEKFRAENEDMLESKNLYFAQLLGLGDHLSHLILDKNFGILKYVPFGEEDIMFPYLLRRAQESKQMLNSVRLQKELIDDEFYKRIGFSK